MRAATLDATVLIRSAGMMFACPGIGSPGSWVKSEARPHGRGALGSVGSGGRIENLALCRSAFPEHSLPITVLVSSNELKSPALNASVGVGISETRQHARTESGPVKIHEEEGFVVPVVNMRNDNRPACGETKTIVSLPESLGTAPERRSPAHSSRHWQDIRKHCRVAG